MKALRVVSALAFASVISAGCSTSGESVQEITLTRADREARIEGVAPAAQPDGNPAIAIPRGLSDQFPVLTLPLRICLKPSWKADGHFLGGAKNYADVRVDDCDHAGSEIPVDRLVLIWHEGGPNKSKTCDNTSICVMHEDNALNPVNCAAGRAYLKGREIGSVSTNLELCGGVP